MPPTSPNDPRRLFQEALSAHAAGRLTEAESLCEQILAADPNQLDPVLLLGVMAAQTGREKLALQRLRKVVEIRPDTPMALKWLAMILRGQGQVEEACRYAQRAVELQPNDPDAIYNLGLCFQQLDDTLQASECFQRATALRPQQAEYWYSLGVSLESLRQTQEAIAAFGRAAKLGPNMEALIRLANLALEEGQAEEAIKYAKRALKLNPEDGAAELLLAEALELAERFDEAAEHFQHAVRLSPDPSRTYALRGIRLQSLGRFDEAFAMFEAGIQLNPRNGQAHHGLATCRKLTEDDRPLADRMEASIDPTTPLESAGYLRFALGKAHDDLGEYESAIRHLDEANRCFHELKPRARVFDPGPYVARVDQIIDLFTRNFFGQYQLRSSRQDPPVFVIGMMRSGTTLLEQILSRHPEIGGAGEMPHWTRFQAAAIDFDTGKFRSVDLLKWIESYCVLLTERCPDNRLVVDKQPANYFTLGLIRVFLWNAKVIHIRRHPVDTSLSIYMNPTQADFAFNRSNIVTGYSQYLRLMDHWSRVLSSDNFLEIQYEDLVADQESVVRTILEFLECPWDPACLVSGTGKERVTTPSFWQVRQPVYRSSVGRWKNYEPWLGEFAELLPSGISSENAPSHGS